MDALLSRLRTILLHKRIWLGVPLVAAAVIVLLAACTALQYPITGLTRRVTLTLLLVAALGGLAIAQLLLARWRPAPVAKLMGEPVWSASLALTAMVGAAGLGAVGLLLLYPSQVGTSKFLGWDFLDKRWLVALYLLACCIVYLPGIFRRLLADPVEAAAVGVASPLGRLWLRGLAAVVAGSVIATLYVAPMLPGSLERFVDAHEQVHMGSFQGMAQGGKPYIDVRTQYGPGHQIVSYEMMRSSEFTLRGFRLSQAWMNIAAAAVLLSLWFFAFGWRAGAAVVAAALAFSPLLIVTFWGWGLVLRWVGPVLIGAILPLVLWGDVRKSTRLIVLVILALACGALAWMAQENLTGPIEALGLVLGAAVVRGAITVRAAIGLFVLFIAVQVAALLSLMTASFGLGHLSEAMKLYFLSTGLVFQGITNTPWSEPSSIWKWAYRATPMVIVVVSTAALYLRRPVKDAADELRIGQVLGMAAAAVPLTMLSLFRADSPHFIATSTAMAPLVVLAVAYLPGRFEWRLDRRNVMRLLLAVVFLAIYLPNPVANLHARTGNYRTFGDPRVVGHRGPTLAGLKILLKGPTPVAASADFMTRRLGFSMPADQRCCFNTQWSFAEWSDAIRQIHTAAGGRSVYVDVVLPLESSGLYFFSDLKVGSPYVSRIMSIWTDGDIRTVEASLLQNRPQCVVSDRPASVFTQTLLKSYGAYTTERLSGPTGITVYCVQDVAKTQ
jgi:hypothetical protein